MGSIRFTAELVPRGPAAALVLDDDQVSAVGEGAKRFPVVATVNGYSWRTSVMRKGGEFLVGLNRAVREEAGVQAGETVDVELVLDTDPREVELPDALANALAADPEARAKFDALAFTHRKEYAQWIDEAKRNETRDRRVAQALQKLRESRTHN
ncbi:MAG: YdeI/OmpD-associated family protein [Actinomycetota bacterium]|nr:YdeI/OmpD-associated family protein [Actinomycetota bacterium]